MKTKISLLYKSGAERNYQTDFGLDDKVTIEIMAEHAKDFVYAAINKAFRTGVNEFIEFVTVDSETVLVNVHDLAEINFKVVN
ncbi:hypothetical protein [Paenibacillus sp. LK1]|uniref:hypothetical protein n=1 Tax=Paenibacillus sp. LK1 TaxID=2053014 RepID=UPI000C186342|nr:hypothetical protein [Paenibacillus sp. LK1]PIH59125.1 hypothetical protein CS562_14395 [Paenibacillus sp. LK1]